MLYLSQFLVCLVPSVHINTKRFFTLFPHFFNYFASSACNCVGVGADGNMSCDSYGGQCSCSEPAEGLDSYFGRQCDQCSFYSYLTPDGCTGMNFERLAICTIKPGSL